MYLDSLIKKEQLRALGPGHINNVMTTMEENEILQIEQHEHEDIAIGGPKKDVPVLQILRMVHRRLKAEVQTKDRDDVKLLAKLMNEFDPKVSFVF